MSKDIKDYLPLYLGCEVCWLDLNFQPTNNIEKLTSEVLNVIEHDVLWNDVKPILRPLSDMSEEERKEANIILETNEGVATVTTHFESMRYLLSKHFDLFGLIDAGLALNKQSL